MYTVLFFALFAAVVTAIPQSNYKRYVGYSVLEVIPTNQDQVKTLRKWMIEKPELDFWQEPSRQLQPVHIMAGQQQLSLLKVNLRKLGLTWTIHKDHLERDIDNFVSKELKRQTSKKVFDINDFNDYDDIMAWLRNDALSTCGSNGFICDIYNTDFDSVEGRDIPVFTVSKDGDTTKPVFFLDATVHAREWLTTATILKIIDHVINDNENELLENLNLVFMPVCNPDGYEYSWTNDRYWRKNRQSFDTCTGVDLNRNCDYNWGEEGVSTNPCSDLYCGPSGNSEPETLALDAELEKYANRINNNGAYVTFHSYGNMWMHPWGNTVNHEGGDCEIASDHDDMYYVADQTADAIENVHNTKWLRGTSCEVIYETTGATDDYAKGVHGIKYPYNPELRGNNFVIDADQIQPSFEEVWAGLVAKREAILDRP